MNESTIIEASLNGHNSSSVSLERGLSDDAVKIKIQFLACF